MEKVLKSGLIEGTMIGLPALQDRPGISRKLVLISRPWLHAILEIAQVDDLATGFFDRCGGQGERCSGTASV